MNDNQNTDHAASSLATGGNTISTAQLEDILDKMTYIGNNLPISASQLDKGLSNKAKVRRINREPSYTLTPKGIAAFCLISAGMAENIDDPAIDIFWKMFTNDMERFGYVQEDREEKSCK